MNELFRLTTIDHLLNKANTVSLRLSRAERRARTIATVLTLRVNTCGEKVE